MSEIRILNGNVNLLKILLGKELAEKLDLNSGDTIVTMETTEQIEVGRNVFEALIQQGWSGYSVKEGKTEKKLNEFESDTEKIVMFGPVAGG